jgi:hypothetical protein
MVVLVGAVVAFREDEKVKLCGLYEEAEATKKGKVIHLVIMGKPNIYWNK